MSVSASVAGAILIPVYGADEVVEVPLDALPDDANDLIDVLKGETASLDVWLQCALGYFAAGRAEQGRLVLDESCEIPEDIFPEAKGERVSLLTALAGHCINAALASPDKRQRKSHFDRAAQLFARADTVDLSDARIWLGRGFLHLHRAELGKARAAFEHALRERPAEPLGVLGLACAAYGLGAAAEALRLFRQLMTSCAQPPPGVRLGLGLCYAQLKQPALARRCFERGLQLDPSDPACALALALSLVNETDDAHAVAAGVHRLAELHRADAANPHVLNQLAGHFFYAREYDKVERLARLAYQAAPAGGRARAESYWHLARCQHARGAWTGAKQFYAEAAKSAPAFMLAQYGLGLMHARVREHGPALEALGKVVRAHPAAPEPLRALARVQLEGGALVEAARSLERLVALDEADADAWALLAHVRTRGGAAASAETPAAAAAGADGGADGARAAESAALRGGLDAYARAVEACRQRGQPTPPALWNNIGVLRARLGKPREAEEALLRARQLSAGGGEAADAVEAAPPALSGVGVTISYNLARLHETSGELARAEEVYASILRIHPTYADAFVGLATCALAKGQRPEAETRLRQAIALNPSHADARCLLGRLHAGAREWHRAKQAFDAVLRDGGADDRRDAYAMLSVGNVLLASASRADDLDAARAGKPPKADRALELYTRVLQREPANMFAAQGVGVVLAEKGYLQEAKELFSLVLEAGGGPERSSAGANLAHIHMREGRPLLAIKLYANCLRHAGERAHLSAHDAEAELTLRLQLAHGQYRAGLLLDCRRTLARALHAHPGSAPLWYNTALALYRAASAAVSQPRAPAESLRAASAQVELSTRLFSRLAGARGGGGGGEWAELGALPDGHAKAYAERCAGLRAPLRELYNDAQARRSEQEARSQQIAQALEAQSAGAAAQAAERGAGDEARAAEQARLAEQRERLAHFQARAQQQREKERMAAERKEARRARAAGGEGEGEEGGDEEGGGEEGGAQEEGGGEEGEPADAAAVKSVRSKEERTEERRKEKKQRRKREKRRRSAEQAARAEGEEGGGAGEAEEADGAEADDGAMEDDDDDDDAGIPEARTGDEGGGEEAAEEAEADMSVAERRAAHSARAQALFGEEEAEGEGEEAAGGAEEEGAQRQAGGEPASAAAPPGTKRRRVIEDDGEDEDA